MGEGHFRMVLASEVDINEGLELFANRRVYWSKVEQDDPVAVINNKIIHAFSNVNSLPLSGIIIQFWAPVDVGLLSTYGQPFSLGPLNRSVCKYRSLSTRYNYNTSSIFNDVDHNVINGGLVAKAFHKLLPEVVFDLRAHKRYGNHLVDKALDSDFTACFMLPVILYPQRNAPVCVGVVECCCMKRSHLLVIFNDLKRALQGVGLAICHSMEQDSYLYKTISNIKPPISEIQDALELLCESHDLTIGQVWIPHVSKSYLMGTERFQTVLVKMIGYRADPDSKNDRFSQIKCFYDNCNLLPLEFGKGIARKTLETYKPHFCSDIRYLSRTLTDNGVLPALLSANTRYSSLVICMKTTGFADYLFEFIWPKTRKYVILLESLLSSLHTCLPSFLLPPPAAAGDDGILRVVNVTQTGTRSLNIPVVTQKQQLNKTITGEKRKFSDLSRHREQSSSSSSSSEEEDTDTTSKEEKDEDDFDDDEDEDDRVLLVFYEEKVTLFLVPDISINLADVKEKINKEFELETCCYSLEYQVDHGMWLTLHDEDEFESCISLSTSANKTHIKLRCFSTN